MKEHPSLKMNEADWDASNAIHRRIALELLGWRWWAWNTEIRVEYQAPRTWQRVISLQPPDFPSDRWKRYGEGSDEGRPIAMSLATPEEIATIKFIEAGAQQPSSWSIDLQDALEVIEVVKLPLTLQRKGKQWCATFGETATGRARNPAMAICLAALEAKGKS